MEENFKNKLGLFTFIFIVLLLGVGGYFFTNYMLNYEDSKSSNNNSKEQISYKIDEDKDYIYFVNNETISEGAEIYYRDVVINLENQNSLTETLEKENKIYKNNIQYLSDIEMLSDELVNYNFDNLYALTFRNYKTYEYSNYVSLVIEDYNYSCFDMNTIIDTKSYIFDVKSGTLLTDEEIFKKYNTNIDLIKEKIKTYLESTQKEVDGVELIKIDETIEDLNYALFINEYGKLNISYLVKTTQVDYNEITEV